MGQLVKESGIPPKAFEPDPNSKPHWSGCGKGFSAKPRRLRGGQREVRF